MKHEKVFSQNGVYEYVVDNNIIMHNEAILAGIKFMREWLSDRSTAAAVSVLDLACGGKPVTIAAIMREFPQVQFNYTGIDINPDQVAKLKSEFHFSHNVTVCDVFEGNAWELGDSRLAAKYDVVFSGLNLHHGVPEELFYLADGVRKKLHVGGLFFGHDVYRPQRFPFVRRPDANPENPQDSWFMIDPKKWIPLPGDFLMAPATAIGAPNDWRVEFVNAERALLNALGADADMISECMSHVYQRDYSLSLSEMKLLFESAEFSVTIVDYSATKHPLKNYFGFISAVTQ